MIPLEIDIHAIVKDLNDWGWRDFKIELACGFGNGYVAQLKCGNVKKPAYQNAARLYNFWESEQALHNRLNSVTT